MGRKYTVTLRWWRVDTVLYLTRQGVLLDGALATFQVDKEAWFLESVPKDMQFVKKSGTT